MSAYDIDFGKTSRAEVKTTWNALIDWCLCFVISVSPIVLIAFFVANTTTPWEYIWNSSDLLFVCVSLALSALFEANLHRGEKWELLRGLLLADIVVACFVYIMAEYSTIVNSPMKISTKHVTIFMVSYTLAVGVTSFILSRKENN